jgi:hypothetical protein
MDRIIINIHSLVDVITNSSTELFVIDKNKSLKFVKEVLQMAIDLHNKSNEQKYTFEDVFDEPKTFEGKYVVEGWEDYYASDIIDGIEIYGASDNSIPYWMFEFIEYTFGYNTERFHLG